MNVKRGFTIFVANSHSTSCLCFSKLNRRYTCEKCCILKYNNDEDKWLKEAREATDKQAAASSSSKITNRATQGGSPNEETSPRPRTDLIEDSPEDTDLSLLTNQQSIGNEGTQLHRDTQNERKSDQHSSTNQTSQAQSNPTTSTAQEEDKNRNTSTSVNKQSNRPKSHKICRYYKKNCCMHGARATICCFLRPRV